MKKVFNIIKSCNQKFIALAGLFVGVSTFLAAINAILRYSGVGAFPWAEELCSYLVVLMVFLSLPYLEFTGQQLTIDIFQTYVKNKTIRVIAKWINGLVTAVFLGLLTYYGFFVTRTAFIRQTKTAVLQMPRYIIYAIIVISFAVAVISWIVLLTAGKKEELE